MKLSAFLSLILFVVLAVTGCKKQTPVEEPAPESMQSPVMQETESEPETAQPAPVHEAKLDEKLVPIPLQLPKPMFVGTPESLQGIPNIEPDSKEPRPVFLAPEGVQNVALNKPLTGSEIDPIMGSLDMIVDGDKEATEGSIVELGPFEQWIMIDLEKEYELYAIVLWHFHKTARVYFDIVVQVSNDPEFITDVVTLFNNDIDNSLGLGVGQDMHYVEKAEGKLIDAKGTKARYVRLWSQANNMNDYSHYIEVEVYGK
jgi:hypothetical protein